MATRDLSIPRGPSELAGRLHLPDDLRPAQRNRAVVISTPGSSVKEQIGATYAARLAARGFVALTFDPAHQGQSGGEPRDLEDPYVRSEDISFALDALAREEVVDPEAIGVLGVCAGGGYAVHVARTDHRIKAVGVVVPVNIGRALVGELLTQPLQVVLGGRVGSTGSYADGMQLWEAAPHRTDLLVVDGAGHYELYDEPAYVDQAVERLASFYHRHLNVAG